MRPPFPGMDPWLEDPTLWPDVHNRLIAAIVDAMTPVVAPKYYIGLVSRTYLIATYDRSPVGVPDLAVATYQPEHANGPRREWGGATPGMVEVLVPEMDEVYETFLEVRRADGGKLVTLLEVLSPTNKMSRKGRRRYLSKRTRVLQSRTSLVEIDLLRAGEPMPVGGPMVSSDYRILVSSSRQRPRARLFPFGIRNPIPNIPLPLLPGEEEPPIPLGEILHAMVERARFDLRLRYDRPAVPPLNDDDSAWAKTITG